MKRMKSCHTGLEGGESRKACWVFGLSVLLLISLFNDYLAAQDRVISFAAGVGMIGEEKLSGFGIHVSGFIPVKDYFEIKFDLSSNAIPPDTGEEGFSDLKIHCFETDFRYGFEPGGGKGFMQLGGGLNLNLVDNGINYDEIIELPDGSQTWGTYDHVLGVGVGLNIGLGFFIVHKIAVYGEFAAQGVSGKAEMGWGGLKFGIRYYPLRVREKIERPWLNQ